MSHVSGIARKGPWAKRWAIAAALFLAGLLARLALGDLLASTPFLTFFPAIAASALFGGWREGMLVLLLSAMAAWYFFLPPPGSFLIEDAATLVSLLSFLAVGAFVILLVSALVDVIRRLETAGRAQEALFRELQHRVANNMQFVASMLRLARRDVADAGASEVLDQAAARIASMARLHRRLQDPATYARGLEPVLRDVLTDLFHTMPVELRLDIRPAPLSLHQMTAIVLLVTEAATNAVKHVFRPELGRRFEVELGVRPDGRLRLAVRDDGPGLDPAPAAARAGQRLGMHIMQALAGQLGGALRIGGGPGTALEVEFAAV
ncbi:sensor histidine kinase [Roseicella aquatilis]|uniref:sensor histidine kinase n=1 Tax=Roseicella aquatilis TaxID=2527868 RepID=UPI001F1007EE|nr:histidine kinase dimerization/phosphoacceptor domain -containing protein [Roseicella aquatilis]